MPTTTVVLKRTITQRQTVSVELCHEPHGEVTWSEDDALDMAQPEDWHDCHIGETIVLGEI